ncbi:DEAD/DEAH box helicase family protein [Burkholderia stagnalis]|uniref:DEAD/DEAH box helicase family protein n=1 Tax=Burkholderia stagnalis TaxID=1503054 RepID=UPI000B2E8D9E|nr:DEAD/DEAH box helicase family protein [Burkholderia stagnalis]
MEIRYVSVPPGAGKTTAALNCLADHVRRGISGTASGYIFYVAPTVELLKQSLRNLRALLEKEGVDSEPYLTLIISDSSLQTVADRITELLDSRAKNQYPFIEGSVLFMTHAAFLTLRSHAAFEKTTVFFDEARKWVEIPAQVDLSDGAKEMFDSLFRLYGEGKVWKLIPKEVPHNKLSSYVVDKSSGKAFKKLEEIYSALTAKDTRVSVYAVMQNVKSDKPVLLTLTLPSRPFNGFKEVYILSADFKTSQMYHLLHNEGVIPLDYSIQFMNQWLPGGYDAAFLSIMNRYRDLTLVPVVDTDAMPSKYGFDNNLLLPKNQSTALANLATELNLTATRVRQIIAYQRDADSGKTILSANDRKFYDAARSMGGKADMLGYLIQASGEIFDAWRDVNPGINEFLLIANNDEMKERRPEGDFVTLSVGSVEGRNDFQHLDCVSFLAAINPDPFVCQVLNDLLSETGYDAHEDYVVDKAIQSLGRAKIRNRASNDPVLAIVATKGLAVRIATRMQGYPRIDLDPMNDRGALEPWTPMEAAKKQRIADGDTRSRKERYLDSGSNKEIESARAQRSKASKKLKDATTDEQRTKAQANIDRWQSVLDDLLARRAA